MRTRFLLFFAGGMVITLAIVSLVSYESMHKVIEKINERSTRSEFSQISTNIISLHADLDRQIDILVNNESIIELMLYDAYTELDKVYAISDFSNNAKRMMTNFPFIHSLYFHFKEDITLCVTPNNVRRYGNAEDIPVERMIPNRVFKQAQKSLSFVGGITAEDYPDLGQDNGQTKLVAAVKKIGEAVIVINILEEHVNTLYEGVEKNDRCMIRLIDREGRIASSMVKSELGATYNLFEKISTTEAGEFTVQDEDNIQVLWTKVADTGLTISNEVSLEQYWSDLSMVFSSIIKIFLIGLVFTVFICFICISIALSPLKQFIESMKRAGTGNYEPMMQPKGNNELSMLVYHHNEMLENLKYLEEKSKEASREQRESELQVLRNQINPHFLYNTLNTIKWMAIVEGNKNIAHCIASLGGLIMPLYKNNNPTCTLAEEIELLKMYLDIMSTRYGGGINFETIVEDGLSDVQVLSLMLQPIVENSIQHGFSNQQNHGTIRLHAYSSGNNLIIMVSDNGVGLTEEEMSRLSTMMQSGGKSSKGSIGMVNTSRRISLQYGQAYGISLEKGEEGGLCVIVTLPLIK